MSQMNPERGIVITGNWKMHKTVQEAVSFLETLAPLIAGSQANVSLGVPFTLIGPLNKEIERLKVNVAIGAQNMHDQPSGAFTGEISASMLKDVGATFVILGHSERRTLFGESDQFINRKVKMAQKAGLTPILCIGESCEEREAGNTEVCLKKQLLGCLEGIETVGSLILAYEPVWAIGTGEAACLEIAAEAHHFCRKLIAERFGKDVAKKMVIQYGGSVKPENAEALLANEEIDGLLVGGASLQAKSFAEIIMKVKP